jgi:cytoskeletal protein CcmA (bactofilin family)
VFSVDNKPDFNRTLGSPPANGAGTAPPPPRPAPAKFETNSPSGGVSVIGNDLTLLGEKITIISQNKLQVDGHVRGNVHGKQVLITEQGSVVGTVFAERIDVRGTVRGAIRAVSVTLHATAKVEGDITNQMLAISEGADFDGRVRRSANTEDLMPVLDPEAIASAEYNNDGAAS